MIYEIEKLQDILLPIMIGIGSFSLLLIAVLLARFLTYIKMKSEYSLHQEKAIEARLKEISEAILDLRITLEKNEKEKDGNGNEKN